MKSIPFFLAYATGLTPIVALTLYVSQTASASIIGSFEQLVGMFEFLNRSFL